MSSALNMAASTGAFLGTLAAGAKTTYIIPLISNAFCQTKFFAGSLGQAGLTLEVISNSVNSMINMGNNVGYLQLNAAHLCIRAEWMSQEESDALVKEHRSHPHLYKFLSAQHQSFSSSLTSANKYQFQLQSCNGLVPYTFFGLRISVTGSGLDTFTPVTSFQIYNQSNRSIQGGFDTYNYTACQIEATDEFNTTFFATVPVYPIAYVERPMELLAEPVNISAAAYINNFLSFYASSTGTYNIDFYVYAWVSLVSMPDGSLKVINT